MTDSMSPTQRHLCMSHIRSSGTKPEKLVRQWLWRHGYRYRLNVKGVPGKPDMVMRPYRTAIFVNGCFWHGHEGCDKFRMPHSNTMFWENKIQRNRERDQHNYMTLHDNGWNIIVIWECQLQPKSLNTTMLQVETQLCENFLALHRHKTVTYDNTERQLPMAAENEMEYISR